ncbi:MAG: hypothetical protein IJZ65_06600, partial [Ruminiclostridium sp.]|nr:hypothetical protein [Ruminiclostridium sp.]
MRKRILMLVLAVTMFSVGIFTPLAEMTGFSVKSGAEESEEYYNYMGNYIRYKSIHYDYLVNDLETPYRNYVLVLSEDVQFMTSVGMWEAYTFQFDADSLKSDTLYNYFISVLMDLVNKETLAGNMSKSLSSISKSVKMTIWKEIAEDIDEENKQTIYDLCLNNGVSVDAWNKMNTAISKNSYSDILKKAGNYLEYFSTFTELIDKVSQAVAIKQYCSGYSAVFADMATHCTGNISLKSALEYMAYICSEDVSEEKLCALFIGEVSMDKLAGDLIGKLNDAVIAKLGLSGIAVKSGQECGQAVADALFGTTSMVNCFYEMAALYDIEDLLKATLKSTDGELFYYSLDLYRKLCAMGFDYSAKYFQITLKDSNFGYFYGWARGVDVDAYLAEVAQKKEAVDRFFELVYVIPDHNYKIETGNYINKNLDINDSVTEDSGETSSYDAFTDSCILPGYVYTDKTADDVSAVVEEDRYLSYSVNGGNNGKNMTLNRDVTIHNDFLVPGGTIDLNGYTLTINGNLNHRSGKIDINGGKLIVNGDYNGFTPVYDEEGNISAYNEGGYLYMKNEADYVKIMGDWTADTKEYYKTSAYGTKGELNLLKGTIELHGN